MNKHHSPMRYLPWFARDVAIWPGSLFALVIAGVVAVMWKISVTVDPGTAPQATGLQTGIWSTALTIAVLLATAGVVGNDMGQGFYRTWFSKPMPAWWYYLQRYLLGAVLILLAPYVLGAGLSLVLHTGLGVTGQLMQTIALAYLLIGSATFLLSIFTPRGWLLVFLIGAMQSILGTVINGFGRISSDQATVWPPLVWVHGLLPPTDLIQPMKPALQGGALLHVVLYGAAMLITALLCLRYRPLGSGGRA